MIKYYLGLAKQYGNLTERYKNAICFVMDKNNIYEAIRLSMESMLLCYLEVIEEDGKYHYVNKWNNVLFDTGNGFRDVTLMDRYESMEKEVFLQGANSRYFFML